MVKYEFPHPNICRASLNKHDCFKKCKYMHINVSKQHKSNNKNATPTMPTVIVNATYVKACSPQPIEIIRDNYKSQLDNRC